jgi:hypothetical protein
MSEARVIPVQPYFGGFVLETLTVGMYGEARNALREYVQNAFDSIQKAIELQQLAPGKGLIRVTLHPDGGGLTIRDNGAGLPVKVAGEILTAIGASRKDYRTDAGFRGIGRLAGIVFSDEVIFRTKAVGESDLTAVTFRAKEMRRLMSPGQGSGQTAEDLLKACVDIRLHAVDPATQPFFEVVLQGFTEAPDECIDPKVLERFLSQVAPVPYRADFAHATKILAEGEGRGIPIEEVALLIEVADQPAVQVFKPYRSEFEVQHPESPATIEVEFFHSDKGRWWGWLGKKELPGSYLEADVRGVRVRAKNIQIDGEGVIREIFQKRSSNNQRYQDWFVGEIFVDLKALTPNARRDGFEDTLVWREVQKEIANSVCKEAGSSAQSISNQGQLTLQKLTDKTDKLGDALGVLRRANFKNQDRTIALSADATKIHADVARAQRNADPSTTADLQQLAARLLDARTEALQHISLGAPDLDREEFEQEVRQVLLAELLGLLEDQLSMPCLTAVRNVIREEYDFPPE